MAPAREKVSCFFMTNCMLLPPSIHQGQDCPSESRTKGQVKQTQLKTQQHGEQLVDGTGKMMTHRQQDGTT
jgi:hypothetical protein